MENLVKKTFTNNAINGLVLFLGFVVFLFLILGYKISDDDFIYKIYSELEDIYFIPTFIFLYVEMLGSFYLRDKKINNKATHFISIIYSFVVSFILYLNIVDYDKLKTSGFIWLLITIEITYLILMYKEDDIKKAMPKEIQFWRNKKSKRNDNITTIIKKEIQNGQINPDTIKIINKRRRMFRHPFSFKGRIRCLEYVISFFIFTLYSTIFLVRLLSLAPFLLY